MWWTHFLLDFSFQVVMGFSMVGKTSLCARFANNQFDEEYMPTYEGSFTKVMSYRGHVRHFPFLFVFVLIFFSSSFHLAPLENEQDLEITITDTQGQSDQDIFRNEYCMGTHGYILVYSVNQKRSLGMLSLHSLKEPSFASTGLRLGVFP